jgi:Arc/MetJ-type ribon-helix-helix transcriptional regulator
MTKQIAVRLPDELVEYLDAGVKSGKGSSRADLVARALDRERRRDIALRDVEILRRPYRDADDLDALVRHTSDLPLDLS